MDDKSFDKFLKDKVENYQDPTFDESALNALHQRMDALGYGTPWYVHYNGALMTAAALTLFTLINFFILKYYNQQDHAELITELEGLKADRKGMLDMQQQIASMGTIHRDTLYIYNEAELLYYQRKLEEMDRALASLQASQTSVPGTEGNLIYLGSGGSISLEDQAILSKYFPLKSDGQALYLVPIEKPSHLYAKDYPHSIDHLPVLAKVYPSQEAMVIERETKTSVPLDGETVRELDKHHRKGVGFRFGPSVELIKTNYNVGDSKPKPGIGVTGEIRFSPFWSLETGAHLENRHYEFEFKDAPDNLDQYPGYDPNLGTLVDVDVSSWVIRIPVNLRYYYPIRGNRALYASVGYSPHIYNLQEFAYEHEIFLGGEVATLNKIAEKKQPRIYIGTINSNMGMSWTLSNQNALQLGVFYRKGLGEMGSEGHELNAYGFKTVYLWNIK